MTDNNALLVRHLIPELKSALSSARIVNLIGSRQAGKTTLVRDLFHDGKFITLDDAPTLAAIDADPIGQLQSLTKDLHDTPLIIDEAQRSRDLSLAIKQIVDKNRRKGQFILTGSSNVFTTAQVADSLAGRMRTLKLWPLTAAECHERPLSRIIDWSLQNKPDIAQLTSPKATREDYIDLLVRGGFPETREIILRERQRQYRDYVDSVVDRDVADILRIRKTDVLRRLIDQMASRTAQELNIAELCKILKIRRETVEQYLDVLLRLSMITKLGAWTSGESKREIKNAKYHFVDSGIICALRRFGNRAFHLEANPGALGSVLESYVFNEILRAAPLQDTDTRLYHWRSTDKREIDIIIDAGSKLTAIEIKASATLSFDDFKHLKWFSKEGPGRTRSVTGIVFYLGNERLTFGDNNFALPVSTLWGVA
jgi:uncharacterized protein